MFKMTTILSNKSLFLVLKSVFISFSAKHCKFQSFFFTSIAFNWKKKSDRYYFDISPKREVNRHQIGEPAVRETKASLSIHEFYNLYFKQELHHVQIFISWRTILLRNFFLKILWAALEVNVCLLTAHYCLYDIKSCQGSTNQIFLQTLHTT